MAKTRHYLFCLIFLYKGERGIENDNSKKRNGDVQVAFSRVKQFCCIGKRSPCNKQDREKIVELLKVLFEN
ncbi:hypothetical protein J2750_001387 [Methanococcoides alaskense]|uniref:Uncharacterized protein n=1 Tax=Methanococcoides alaskense TaxID=325778 RepID=A0AA90TZL6_9EURY|nr:hypothetical protein [Methanococcoides alaskense]